MKLLVAALTLAWILGGTGEGQSRQAEQTTRLSHLRTVGMERANQCRFDWMDPGRWTQREEDRTAWCVLKRWPVAGGFAKLSSVISCESGWNRFAYNSGGPYVGLAQHALASWAARVAAYQPPWWHLKPNWTNSRTMLVVTIRMAHDVGWGPWSLRDTDNKLVEALERLSTLDTDPVQTSGQYEADALQALPLVRQLVEERDMLLGQVAHIGRVSEQRQQENERLKRLVSLQTETSEALRKQNADLKEENERLKGRETVWREVEQKYADALVRLSAAEEKLLTYVAHEEDFLRAEEVVEAADKYTDHPSEGAMADLISSLRRYEEGKNA